MIPCRWEVIKERKDMEREGGEREQSGQSALWCVNELEKYRQPGGED